jgi:hypothetical protein
VMDGPSFINYANWPGNTYYLVPDSPTGTNILVRPNKYESGRGHIAVMNWDHNSTVNVDISSIVTVGKAYEVRNAQDYFNTPVLTGTYGGGSITLPMTGLTQATPIGDAAQPTSGPEFNVFVVRTTN